MKKVIIITLCLFSGMGHAKESQWTLKGLIQHAYAHREDLKSAQSSVEEARWKIKEVFTHFLPRINVNFTGTQAFSEYAFDFSANKISTQVNTVMETPMGSTPLEIPIEANMPEDVRMMDDRYANLSVTLDYSIFNWGKISHYHKASKQGIKINQHKAVKEKVEVATQVREVFYGFQVAGLAIEFAEKMVADITIVQSLLKQFLGQEEEGNFRVTQLDMMDVEDFLAQAKDGLLEAQQAQKSTLNHISLLAGMNTPLTPEDITQEDPASLQLQPVEIYLSKGLDTNPLLKAMENGMRAEAHLAKAVMADCFPQLGLRAFYYHFIDSVGAYPKNYGGISVALQWQMAFGENRFRSKQHQARSQQISSTQKFYQQLVATQIRNTYEEIQNLLKRLEMNQHRYGRLKKRSKLALFGLKNKVTSYREYRESFMMKMVVKQDYFKLLLKLHNKNNELINLTGAI